MPLISSISDLQKFAIAFSADLKPGDIIVLTGPLGAGKTTFTQYLAAALGITEPVTSPTFIYMNVYDLPKPKNGISQFVHIDAYRLTPDAAHDKGILDHIGQLGSVTIIEWGEKISSVLPKAARSVSIRVDSMDARTITIT